MPGHRSGAVSVVLVNFRGTDDTLEAIASLGRMDWPTDDLEIVVVENASGDDSADRIRAAAPHVKLIVSPTNEGFAGGCNRGVAASSGEFVALLNNDARPDEGWVRAAVECFSSAPDIGAVASRVLDWEGELVDYIGAAMTWYGMGYKPFTGEKPPRVPPGRSDVLFGTGSAMFVRRSVWDALDGFDERYFMFFEDVDLGWRLNLAGWRFVYEPASLAYHKHHASIAAFGSFKETYLLERNALFTLYKNAGEKYLPDALPAALGLAVRRAMTRGELDSSSFDLRRSSDDGSVMQIDKGVVASAFAIDQFVELLPSLKLSRDEIQGSRVVPESRIRALFGELDAPIHHEKPYVRGYENLVGAFDLVEVPGTTKVVVVTGDPVGVKLAGPAIRAWNIAEALSAQNAVTLVSLTGIEEGTDAPFQLAGVAPGDDRAFSKLERWADVIIFQGHAMAVFDSLRRSDKILVVDIYDPMHLEQLEQASGLPQPIWEGQVSDATDVLNQQLERGDFFICASERQRHFYLGQLAALGRINPRTYTDDPDLRGLIDVVPFGLSSTPPVHDHAVVKGVVPGIGADDHLILWGGGLYNWFDPETLIRAVALLAERRPSVRLFFQGTKHPHPGVPEMEIVARSRALAGELGVRDRNVFFHDSWVDYADRQNYLTEADLGVSTHHAHIETTFSFRTRILDYLWAGLPMVVTEGDYFAELIETEGLGIAVPAGDVSALADALEKMLFDETARKRAGQSAARVREDFTWERVLEPVVAFVSDPHRARDAGSSSRTSARRARRRSGLLYDVRRAVFYLRTAGPATVADKVARRLRRR